MTAISPAPLPQEETPATESGLGTLLRLVFSGRVNILLTVLSLTLLVLVVPPLFRWAITEARFTGTAEECRAGSGACWAFVAAKPRFIFFAFYPGDQLWRPAGIILGLLSPMVASALPALWGRGLLIAWPLALLAAWGLMAGGGPLTRVAV